MRLTVSPSENPRVWTFDQTIVTIGSGGGPVQADLGLSDQELQPTHVKIIKDGSRFLVFNVANDPFVSLNEHPFGKKEIKNNDLLQIGSHYILFEIKESEPEEQAQVKPFSTKIEMEGYNSKEDKFQAIPLRTHQVNQLEKLDLDDLMHEVEQFEQNIQKDNQPTVSANDETPKITFQDYFAPFKKIEDEPESLKEAAMPAVIATKKQPIQYQVGEFDDESENWTTEKNDKLVPEPKSNDFMGLINWKMIGTIVVSFSLILLLIASALYFNVSATNENEELSAAESVADVAMALKYAQIHHIKPHKKNWSDPEFIKRSLAQVIPHDYPSLAKIDSQGHLNDTSYSLRIYTSTDFSQFLVIAQPAPSLLQWLIPKTAIVVDSKLMQLKKVADMKTLNRLLVNSNNLDNSNAIGVTNLVKRGQLIPLHTLAQKRKGQDFSPPKALTMLRPGAEDYIYNAPRYYQLGETIMKRAIDLMEMPGSAYEMSRLKQDMSILSKMHDMVLYSSNGIQLTLDVQKAIAAFVSNSRFLTAYLKFDPQGIIINSHLIIDDESSHHPIETPKTPKSVPDKIAEESVITDNADSKTLEPDAPIEQHPVLTQLNSLCRARETVLSPLKNQIAAFFNEDTKHPVPEFESHLTLMLRQYFETDIKQKQEMAKAIHQLSKEYRLMPLGELMGYMKQAGLGEDCKEVLKHGVQSEKQNELLQSYVDRIKSAENFIELEKILNTAAKKLVVKNFSDLNQLQMAQRLIKIEAISRVNKLLLSSLPTSLESRQDPKQRVALQYVVQQTLDTLEEQTYYLDELDRKQGEEG